MSEGSYSLPWLISKFVSWQQVKKVLLTSGLRRGVVTLVGGGALAQAFSVITSPINSRLYSPVDYGVAAVFGSVVGILLLLGTFRYEMAITLPADEEKARDLLFLCLGLGMLSASVAALFAWSAGPRFFAWIGVPRLYRYWWMIPLALLGGSFYQSLNYWVLRNKDYRSLATTRFKQSLSGSLTSIGFGLWRSDPIGLLVGAFMSSSAGVIQLSRGAFHVRAVARPGRLLSRLRAVASEYFKFAAFTSGAGLLNAVGTIVPPVIISALYGEAVTGSFSFALRLVGLPVGLVGTAVSQVFLAEASQLVRERPVELPDFFRKVRRKMSLLSGGILLLGVISIPLFPLVFGGRWRMAGLFAGLMSIYCAAQIVVSPISTICLILKRQDVQFFLDALRAVVVVLALWLPGKLGGSCLAAIGCFSLAMTVTYGIYYSVYSHLASNCGKKNNLGKNRLVDSA